MSTLTVAPAAVARENRVLADRFGGTILREIALVAAGTIAMIVLARISVPLPFTPVPVSLGTLGALSVGTTLGVRRGLVSVGAYALLGIAGAPVFTGSNVGWAFASFGYILGYFLVAAIAGLAAQRGADRPRPPSPPEPSRCCAPSSADTTPSGVTRVGLVPTGGGAAVMCAAQGR